MPRYESSKDLELENNFSGFLRDNYGLRAQKLSEIKYIVDWAFYHYASGKLVFFAEFKRRNNVMDKYPTYMISLNKWIKGVELTRATGVDFLIVVQFNDGFFFIRQRDVKKAEIKEGGRRDRGDKNDIEPCVFIPMENFQYLPKRTDLDPNPLVE